MKSHKNRVYVATPDHDLIQELSQSININKILATILTQRGIVNFDLAKRYFRPKLDHLNDPFLMKNMQKAVDRLTCAINTSERILIYGDYDVDGTTSVALVYNVLQEICSNQLNFYAPDRYEEGYGISLKGIDEAKKMGVTLIIALDCGIQARQQVVYAQEKGIDFIICDHHLPGQEIPEAVAVLDPKQKNCAYPYKELSGCGIGFKFMQAYIQQHGLSQDILHKQLDLLGLSIAADIVPMTGENRVLMYYALRKLHEDPQIGIKALMDFVELLPPYDVTDLVFGIAPKINAAGRMMHAEHAIHLMITQDSSQATNLAEVLTQENYKRQELDRKTSQEALTLMENQKEHFNFSTVLSQPHWHKGIIGIVASRCIETYHRPTIILTENETGQMTGSARSIQGFDIYQAIAECAEYLTKFGGHHAAAGLSMPKENFEKFRGKFENICRSKLSRSNLNPQIAVNMVIDFEQITQKFYNLLDQFAPFGPENMRPVFETRHVFAPQVRLLKGKHLRMTLEQNNVKIEAIAFDFGSFYQHILKGKSFSICYVIERMTYEKHTYMNLNIKDISFSN